MHPDIEALGLWLGAFIFWGFGGLIGPPDALKKNMLASKL
jgi:hypothetical protein